MTTIACDGVWIAADGRATSGAVVIAETAQKLHVSGGRIYGYAGTASFKMPMIAWIEAGADPDKAPKIHDDDDWQMMIVMRDHRVATITKRAPYLLLQEIPCARGTGSDFALAAMDLDRCAEGAVRAAMRRDIHSGGTVAVLNIWDELGAPVADPMWADIKPVVFDNTQDVKAAA